MNPEQAASAVEDAAGSAPVGTLLRLRCVYFFYFSTVGTIAPYFGLYLQSLSFDARQIGELTAILLGSKIIAPYVWGWLGDATGRRFAVARFAAVFSLISFGMLSLASEYAWLLLALLFYGFFWNAGMPQFEAATMESLGNARHRYGRIRLWGSVGFVVAASVLGLVFHAYGMQWFSYVVVLMLAAIFLSMLGLPEPVRQQRSSMSEGASIMSVLRQPAVVSLLLGCFLMQMSHGPYYAFFSIYAEELSYQRQIIGVLWSLGVAAEIAVFLWMAPLLGRFGAERLFQASLVVAVLRWILTAAYARSFAVLMLAQLMHAATFGLFHAAAIELIHRWFPVGLRGRGQALYSSVSFGLGGAVGSLGAGYLWKAIPSSTVFALSAVVAAIGLVATWFGLIKRDAASVAVQ